LRNSTKFGPSKIAESLGVVISILVPDTRMVMARFLSYWK
jgi:hypothetical protein